MTFFSKVLSARAAALSALAGLVMVSLPGVSLAQMPTWTHTTTNPGLVTAMGALHDMTHGHTGAGPSARITQTGRNNAVGVRQTGGRQRVAIHQNGCNNTATSSQSAQNVLNTVIQHGCNNTHHSAQARPNTARMTVQWGQ